MDITPALTRFIVTGRSRDEIDEQTALGYAAKVPRSLVEELFAVGTPDDRRTTGPVPRPWHALSRRRQRRRDPTESAQKRGHHRALHQGRAQAEKAGRESIPLTEEHDPQCR
jgi:hypothetical protein